jgi:hypothetical protein
MELKRRLVTINNEIYSWVWLALVYEELPSLRTSNGFYNTHRYNLSLF